MGRSRREGIGEEDKSVPQPLADDDIEILEVVGLESDDDEPEVRPTRRGSRAAEPPDVVVDIDEPSAGRHGSGAADTREQLLRLSADFENYRRRVDRDREAHLRQATAGLVSRLLPVLDNFERALAREPGQGAERFYDGVVLIFRQLLEELRAEGLVAVDSVGEPFDPEVHEAVATAEEEALPPNVVVEELQRGYRLHSRLLRPALVRVTIDRATPGAPSGRQTRGG